MYEIVAENPVARKQDLRIDPAPRPESLDGKVIGFYWNGKQGGDTALKQLEVCLKNEYPGIITKRMYLRYYPLKSHDLENLAQECDLVVGATGD